MNDGLAENQFSRRVFVRTFGAGLGAIVLRPECLLAVDRSLPDLSFVVVSDTHLGYRDNESAAIQWSKTATELQKASGSFVLHLGDVVDGGREAQYPIYLKARESIEKPVYEIPGNHDPIPLFQKHLRKQVDTIVDHEWLRCILVNNARTDSHDGFLAGEQLAWIDDACKEAAADGRYSILCMHVPAHTNRHPDRGWYVKLENGQKELYALLERHRANVLALFHGHFHNGIRGWNDNAPVQEICFPSALYNLDRKLEQQHAPGYNLPEFQPGYTLVSIAKGTMELQFKPIGKEPSVHKDCKLSQLPAV